MPDTTFHSDYRIEPVGERCLLIRFGSKVDAEVSHRVHLASAVLSAAALPGVQDVVAALTTVAVHYLPQALPGPGRPYTQMRERVHLALAAQGQTLAVSSRQLDIPVCYGGRHGPDLEEVAQRCKLLPSEVIERHGAAELTVYAFFFAPGHPFCGPVPEELRLPRRATPRTRVPAGSVATANGLSTIYQTASPGGWHIIGRTPMSVFDLNRDPPCTLAVGDRIRFVPITEAAFDSYEGERP